jgi:hypothetical protein
VHELTGHCAWTHDGQCRLPPGRQKNLKVDGCVETMHKSAFTKSSHFELISSTAPDMISQLLMHAPRPSQLDNAVDRLHIHTGGVYRSLYITFCKNRLEVLQLLAFVPSGIGIVAGIGKPGSLPHVGEDQQGARFPYCTAWNAVIGNLLIGHSPSCAGTGISGSDRRQQAQDMCLYCKNGAFRAPTARI